MVFGDTWAPNSIHACLYVCITGAANGANGDAWIMLRCVRVFGWCLRFAGW